MYIKYALPCKASYSYLPPTPNLLVLNYEFPSQTKECKYMKCVFARKRSPLQIIFCTSSTWSQIFFPQIVGDKLGNKFRSKDLKMCLFMCNPEGFTPCSVTVCLSHTHTCCDLPLHSKSEHTHLSAWVRSVAVNNRRLGWDQTVQVPGKQGRGFHLNMLRTSEKSENKLMSP